VVPLIGVNRAFVVKGLQVMRGQSNVGLAALARAARIGEPINAFHLAFLIGPRINAGGRIGDAALGSRLLATDDPVEAQSIAETLDRLNQERQAMETEMLAVLVTANPSWHPGIVGLLASRLKDHARRPAFAIAFNANGVGTGSGRSVPGFDLGRMVREAVEAGLLVKGGGHAMAAGITVEKEKLGALRAFFEERAAADVFRLQDQESLLIDGALAAEGVTLQLLDTLEKAGPYGTGHVAPVFALPRHRLVDARLVGANHIRAELRSESGGRIQAIAFRAADSALGDFLFRSRGSTIHTAGSLSSNYWNGNRSAQFRIVDAAEA
jgi:single-stranded-DNA-specific exonuclease